MKHDLLKVGSVLVALNPRDKTFEVNPHMQDAADLRDVLFNSEADARVILDRQVALGEAEKDEMSGSHFADAYGVANLEDEGFEHVWRVVDRDREYTDTAMLLFPFADVALMRDVLAESHALYAQMAVRQVEVVRDYNWDLLEAAAA